MDLSDFIYFSAMCNQFVVIAIGRVREPNTNISTLLDVTVKDIILKIVI